VIIGFRDDHGQRGSFPLASPIVIDRPMKLDQNGNVVVADTANNRE
jgi:hypothetical protein